MEWALSFAQFYSYELPKYASLYTFSRGAPIDVARNKIAVDAIRQNVKWVFFLDSVPSYTPLLAKDTLGRINIMPIGELATFYDIGLERQPSLFMVRDDNDRWTKIKHIVRHPFKGTLRRVNTVGGMIDLSLNHCIYGRGNSRNLEEANLLSAEKLRVGQYLAMPRLHVFIEGNFFLGREDLAWFYGFFMAEGSVSKDLSVISLSNMNEELVIRAREIFEDYFNKLVHTLADRNLTKIECSNIGLARCLRDKFYTSDGDKRVPPEIISAPTGIKLSFLRGYNDGDGDKSDPSQEFQSFACGSQVEAMGLLYLLKSAGLDKDSVHVREDKPNFIQISIGKQLYERKDRGQIKKIIDIPYDGYLYDIETETHTFAGGVGMFKLHNSDNLVPVNAVERLMSHNQPIVGGFYFRRHPPITPTMWRRMPPETWATGGKYTPIMEFQKNSLVEVDVAGNGLTLVSTRVFEKINPEAVKYIREHGNEPRFDVANCPAFVEKPWFSWKMGREPLGTSEDFEFFSLCQEAGFKVYVDTGCVSPHISQVRFTMDSGKQPPNLLKFGEIEVIFPEL